MDKSDIYKHARWAMEIPELFEDGELSSKRMETLPEKTQRYLIYQTLTTLSDYFSVVPDFYSNKSVSVENTIDGLSDTLPVWLTRLSDLRVFQVVNGLLDIINFKTKYKEFPPKSVMEFYAVCKECKPPYCEKYKSNNELSQEEIYKKSEIKKVQDYNRSWYKSLNEEQKTKVYFGAREAAPAIEYFLSINNESFLEKGFENSAHFNYMIEAFLGYYRLYSVRDIK